MKERLNTVQEIVDRYSVVSNPIKRNFCLALGCLFVVFSIVGIWIPGWPTVSWAIPAAFLFSISNKKLFVWTLENPYFGSAIFEYYATGKTLSNHVKFIVMIMIALMTIVSSYFVLHLSTIGDGTLFDVSSWSGKDQYALGSIAIILVGLVGILYVYTAVATRKKIKS